MYYKTCAGIGHPGYSKSINTKLNHRRCSYIDDFLMINLAYFGAPDPLRGVVLSPSIESEQIALRHLPDSLRVRHLTQDVTHACQSLNEDGCGTRKNLRMS